MTARAIIFLERDSRRFWAKVALPDENGCMLWTAGLIRGYGSIMALGEDGRWHNAGAHRIACMWAHGEPPTPAHEAAHSCRNTRCVAPEHLRWATRSENQRDRLRDGTHVRGERCVTSKLTSEQVLEIRRRADEGTSALARAFGVSHGAIRGVLTRQNWAHLSESGVGQR